MKYVKCQYNIQQAVWPPGSADKVCLRSPLTLTFDRLTLKLVCESDLSWGTFLPNLGTLSLCVLELFAMYATDGQTDIQTDRWTDKSNAYCPLRLADWLSGNALASINVVALRQTQLVSGWVTVCGRVNHLGM